MKINSDFRPVKTRPIGLVVDGKPYNSLRDASNKLNVSYQSILKAYRKLSRGAMPNINVEMNIRKTFNLERLEREA